MCCKNVWPLNYNTGPQLIALVSDFLEYLKGIAQHKAIVAIESSSSQNFWGSTETRTRIAGFKVQSAHHYTMEPVMLINNERSEFSDRRKLQDQSVNASEVIRRMMLMFNLITWVLCRDFHLMICFTLLKVYKKSILTFLVPLMIKGATYSAEL